MNIDTDLVGYCLAMVGALGLLIWLRPRWDTGGGMMLIIAFLAVAWPLVMVGIIAICAYFLIRGAGTVIFYIFIAPVIWLRRHWRAA